MLKRLNHEIRRRFRVPSPFLSMVAYLRLVTYYLMEYTEDWSTDYSYLSPHKLDIQAKQQSEAQAA